MRISTMAAATQVLYSSPLEGSSVVLNYDDTNLKAHSISINVGDSGHPLTYFLTISGVGNSNRYPQKGNGSFVLAPPLHGVASTDPRGGATIRWGIEPYGVSFT